MAIERDKIERLLSPVNDILENFGLKAITIQSKATKSAISAQEYSAALRKARAELNALAKRTKDETAAKYSRLFTEIINSDLDTQIAMYERGYKKGIVKSEPFIPDMVKFKAAQELSREFLFLAQTIDKVNYYGGAKLAGIMQKATDEVLQGTPVNTVSRAAAQQIAEEGISITYASGRQVNDIVAYTRSNLVTAIGQSALELQSELFNSIDAEDKWYETSSHFGARPTHAVWQGKIFKSWDKFVDATGYGEVDGLGGINCRHTFYPFIPGVSEQAFTPFPLKENNAQYEALQEQRGLESSVRKWKQRLAANENLGVEDNLARQKIGLYQSKLRTLVKEEGLTRQYIREQI